MYVYNASRHQNGPSGRFAQSADPASQGRTARAAMRVLLADDHDMVRETISAYLLAAGDVDVVTVADYEAAIDALTAGPDFDLVLLDYNMPGMNGLDGLQRCRRRFPDQCIAILSGSAPARIAQEAVDSGASGFLPKTLGAKSLLNAIRFMVSGETYLPVSMLQNAVEEAQHPARAQFSQREIDVLGGLCRGLSNKEIARELELQEVTIKLHVRTVCKKTGAKNRTQAALYGKELGLF
jgi:DNA-binding NarL/FixJ family response regulator